MFDQNVMSTSYKTYKLSHVLKQHETTTSLFQTRPQDTTAYALNIRGSEIIFHCVMNYSLCSQHT
jgi:hypothetical protein